MAPNEPTIASILRDLANEYDAVVPASEIYGRVLERRPTSAKRPESVIRNQLRTDGPSMGWVSISPQELIPLHVVLQGLRFRLTPSAAEIAAGAIQTLALYPFIGADEATPLQFVDAAQHPIVGGFSTLDLNKYRYLRPEPAALSLGGWMRQAGVQAGDSLLATVASVTPRVIVLEREPATAFRRAEAERQDRELADALVALTAIGSRAARQPHNSVLAVFAQAAWRTGYPGSTWQHVVQADRRLHLAQGALIENLNNTNMFTFLMDEEGQSKLQSNLLQEIFAFQHELLATRRHDAERGLWDGFSARASSAQTIFDLERHAQQILYGGKINALEDYTATIEENLSDLEYEADPADAQVLFGDMPSLGFGMGDLEPIDDVQSFVDQNPEVAEATRRLMASLTPDEQRRLDAARTMEDVQQVLGPHLADLLRTEPSLFVPLVAKGDGSLDTNGANIQSQGAALDLTGLPTPDLIAPDLAWSDDEDGDDWDEDDDDDDWDEDDEDDDDWDEDIDIFVDSRQARRAMARSKALMAQFVDHQVRHRKSRQTSQSRADDLWLYADFLSHYYGHALDAGGYATLDEFLFFFYPRKVMNSTERHVREICTSVKQFYAFLKAEKLIDDDAFAGAIWQRRDQAARLIQLFDQVDSDAEQFERLFAHLFAPYTA